MSDMFQLIFGLGTIVFLGMSLKIIQTLSIIHTIALNLIDCFLFANNFEKQKKDFKLVNVKKLN